MLKVEKFLQNDLAGLAELFKELMLAIENICVRRNCYYTMFVSASKRKDAHKFYESIGYRLDVVQGFKKYFN